MSYEVVPYDPQFRDQVLALQVHLWTKNLNLNSAYMRWKYEENPYLQNPLIYLALAEGQVVGMRGMIGASWALGTPATSVVAPVGGDTVVAPEHRKRGLFQMIDEAAEQDLLSRGFRFAFNFSANPGTYILSVRRGWRLAGAHKNLFRAPGPPSPDSVDRVRAQRARLSSGPEPRALEMADLVRRIGNDGRLRHQRDEAYYLWRFRNPLNSYGFVFWEDERLEGFLVVRRDRNGGLSRPHILDWTASSKDVADDLLAAAEVAFGKGQLAIWSATLDTHQLQALKAAGFEAVDDTRGIDRYLPGVLVRCLDPQVQEADWQLAGTSLVDIANWDLRMIYSDGF